MTIPDETEYIVPKGDFSVFNILSPGYISWVHIHPLFLCEMTLSLFQVFDIGN